MKLRVILDFEADDSPDVSPTGRTTPLPVTALQHYLDAMLRHQDLGTTFGVRNLADVGFTAPRLVAATAHS